MSGFNWLEVSPLALTDGNKISKLEMLAETTWFMPFWMAREFAKHRSLKVKSLTVMANSITFFDDLTIDFLKQQNKSVIANLANHKLMMMATTKVCFEPSQKSIETLLKQRLEGWRQFLQNGEKSECVFNISEHFTQAKEIVIVRNDPFSHSFKQTYIAPTSVKIEDISIFDLTKLILREDFSIHELSGCVNISNFEVSDFDLEICNNAMQFFKDTKGSEEGATEFAKQFISAKTTKTKCISTKEFSKMEDFSGMVKLQRYDGVLNNLIFKKELRVIRNDRYFDAYGFKKINMNMSLAQMPEFVCNAAKATGEYIETDIKQLYTKLFVNECYGYWEHIKLSATNKEGDNFVFNMRDVIENLSDKEKDIFLDESLKTV